MSKILFKSQVFRNLLPKIEIAVVVPDTSPRGDNIPDDENYKLGCQGAGFYLKCYF